LRDGFALEFRAVFSAFGHEHSFGTLCLFSRVSAVTG